MPKLRPNDSGRIAALGLSSVLAACTGGGGSGAPGGTPAPDAAIDGAGADGAGAAGGANPTHDLGAPALDEGPSPRGADAAASAPTCDPTPVLAACAGCHGPQRAEGGLDLVSPGLAGRLVGVGSTRCPGETLVDANDPERSMLLTLVDAERHGAAGFGSPGRCALGLMPPETTGLDAVSIACLESYVSGLAATGLPEPPPPDETVAVESALAKVKTLLTGGAPTDEERARVAADPMALRALVSAWVETAEFETKLLPFLRTALQQDLVGTLDEQLDKPRGRATRLRLLDANVSDSFARTAARIVRDRRPFTEVATTRDWELTTALAISLAFTDLNADGREVTHTLTRTPPANAPRPVTLEWMIANRTWVEPSIPAECRFAPEVPAERLLDFLLGLVRCQGGMPDYKFDNPLLLASDFTDWRTVTLANAGADSPTFEFYDLESLRGADTMPLHIRRGGFFSTLAFLANYPTNEDNLFRVTTNQGLIVALQRTFSASDPTEPFPSEALDEGHATPGTSCHGCHALLDPMRVAFWEVFTPVYQRTTARTDFEGRFAFDGFRYEETTQTPIAFGRALATHPRFKTAWVQRICYWANARPCDEAKPAFQAIAHAFEAGGFDFRNMLVDLLSSPLITGAADISITRANHLCPLIEVRMGDDTLCDGLGEALGLIPRDEFSRGEVVPAMAADPSTFSFAAGEALCQRISSRLVGGEAADRPLRTDDVAGGLRRLVEGLMGLSPAHPRHDVALATLQRHYDEARAAAEGSSQLALRSAAMTACLSPDVMGMGL